MKTDARETRFVWTPAQDDALRAGILDGKSHTEIASELGRSRNACIGRANRLGLSNPKRPTVSRRKLYLREQAEKTKRTMDAFADALAETGRVDHASGIAGISRQRGSQLFLRIKQDIDGAQRKAGFERWCV